mmetsp:Transcript_36211/g.94188  ORF Transcript_36211/g.94188 Transcript_36211/m.94188 type:complete len:237 (+) Transcript_36211:105-815(+)
MPRGLEVVERSAIKQTIQRTRIHAYFYILPASPNLAPEAIEDYSSNKCARCCSHKRGNCTTGYNIAHQGRLQGEVICTEILQVVVSLHPLCQLLDAVALVIQIYVRKQKNDDTDKQESGKQPSPVLSDNAPFQHEYNEKSSTKSSKDEEVTIDGSEVREAVLDHDRLDASRICNLLMSSRAEGRGGSYLFGISLYDSRSCISNMVVVVRFCPYLFSRTSLIFRLPPTLTRTRSLEL